MDTNEFNGVNQQAPNYQNNVGYQQPQNNMNYSNGQGMGYVANQAPKKAPNIFKQFAFSFVPPQYRELARAKVGSMIFLIILLVFLLTGFSFLTLAAGYVLSGGVSEMLDLFPDFSVEYGEFSIDQDFYVEEENTVVYMTEDVRYFDYDDVMDYRDEGFDSIMLVGRENMCIYSDREFQELYFYELGDISFDKETIENTFVPMIWLILLVWYAIWFVLRVLWYFLCATIYLLVGMLLALMFGKKISAGHIFKAAVFAKIPMFIIASLWNLLPIDLSFPGIIRVLATLVLFGFGVWFLPVKEEQYRRY